MSLTHSQRCKNTVLSQSTKIKEENLSLSLSSPSSQHFSLCSRPVRSSVRYAHSSRRCSFRSLPTSIFIFNSSSQFLFSYLIF
ncbi:hypothetical protein RIF29_13189 [Crotalaria pallida]|uniref:Uncharacterized protein n=1 Tax=Crotalaria pallida TaxID=3830 RepID=A0AAN9INZ9_CROPI